MGERKRKWDVPQNSSESVDDPSLIAQKAAEKINAMLAAKGIIKQKEQLVEEIEINDCPGRVHLTKGTTCQEIRMLTGATVITRGRYIPAAERLPDERPLYLRISADTKESLDAAVKKVKELMKGPPSTGQHSAIVFVGIEVAEAQSVSFNLIGKILGPKGSFVKHIVNESGAKVQLRGRGYTETPKTEDSPEALHLFVSANSKAAMEKAKTLAENLVNHVKEDFNTSKNKSTRGPPVAPLPGGPVSTTPYGVAAGYSASMPPTYPGGPYGYPPTGTNSTSQTYQPIPSPYGYPAYAMSGHMYAVPPYNQYGYLDPYSQYQGYPSYGEQTQTEVSGSRQDQEEPAHSPSTTSPSNTPRRFQEYPTKRIRAADDGNDEEPQMGPQRPTKEEYESSTLPEAPPASENTSNYETKSTLPPPRRGSGGKQSSENTVDTTFSSGFVKLGSANRNNKSNTNAAPKANTRPSVRLVAYDADEPTSDSIPPTNKLPFWAVPATKESQSWSKTTFK